MCRSCCSKCAGREELYCTKCYAYDEMDEPVRDTTLANTDEIIDLVVATDSEDE
jgi:hypothetical protein